jgi:hypothetical protein
MLYRPYAGCRIGGARCCALFASCDSDGRLDCTCTDGTEKPVAEMEARSGLMAVSYPSSQTSARQR